MFNQHVCDSLTQAFVNVASAMPFDSDTDLKWHAQCYMESDLCYEINVKLAHILGKGE